jgi:hypothetical protein
MELWSSSSVRYLLAFLTGNFLGGGDGLGKERQIDTPSLAVAVSNNRPIRPPLDLCFAFFARDLSEEKTCGGGGEERENPTSYHPDCPGMSVQDETIKEPLLRGGETIKSVSSLGRVLRRYFGPFSFYPTRSRNRVSGEREGKWKKESGDRIDFSHWLPPIVLSLCEIEPQFYFHAHLVNIFVTLNILRKKVYCLLPISRACRRQQQQQQQQQTAQQGRPLPPPDAKQVC